LYMADTVRRESRGLCPDVWHAVLKKFLSGTHLFICVHTGV
jgi:hypothetical protein